MNEFVEIPGFNNYLINRQGVILSKFKDDRLKTQIQNSGYEICHLSKEGERKAKLVHRIVAKTFIPNPENKPQVNHKNGIKTDNRAVNLEWVSLEENMRHAFDNGLMENNIERGKRLMSVVGKRYSKVNGDRLRQFSKETSKPVIQLDLEGNFIKEYPSIKSARRETGIGNINRAVSGLYKQVGGFKWVLRSNYISK